MLPPLQVSIGYRQSVSGAACGGDIIFAVLPGIEDGECDAVMSSALFILGVVVEC